MWETTLNSPMLWSELSPAELAARGICELPRNLDEAEEWREYHQSISQWETDRYARLF